MNERSLLGMYGFAEDYRSAEGRYNAQRSPGDPKAHGRQRYITTVGWYRGADGQETTVNGMSGSVMAFAEGANQGEEEIGQDF